VTPISHLASNHPVSNSVFRVLILSTPCFATKLSIYKTNISTNNAHIAGLFRLVILFLHREKRSDIAGTGGSIMHQEQDTFYYIFPTNVQYMLTIYLSYRGARGGAVG
jgi:hypothetical protein